MARNVIFNLRIGGGSGTEPFYGWLEIYRTASPYPIRSGDTRVWVEEVRTTAPKVSLAPTTDDWHYRAVLTPFNGEPSAMFEFTLADGTADITISNMELVNNGS